MKIKNVFDTIFSMENLYGALEDASRGRRFKKDVLSFNANAWECLNYIRAKVYNGTYSIEHYYIFYVYEPKKRMIMSIRFQHRVVQWAIYRVINPILTKGYIEDSYGCIECRGSLKAMKRLKYWLKYVDRKEGNWYYLKLDISKYFYRISHRVLKKILTKKIKDKRLLNLLYKIIDCDHTPFGLPKGYSPGQVPLEERLFDVGIPIGNLLSQLFANLYLDALDQYCKRVLRIRYYIRYMDDVIILSNSKKQLHIWKNQIEKFLNDRLELQLNKKTCIRPINQGIEFVGYRLWSNKVTLRKKTTLHMKRVLKVKKEAYERGEIDLIEVSKTLITYIGVMRHCDCDNLKKKMINNFVLKRVREEGGGINGSNYDGNGGETKRDHQITV